MIENFCDAIRAQELRGKCFSLVAVAEGVKRREVGVAASNLVARQEFGRIVCRKAGKMDSAPLDEALERMKFIDPNSEIIHAARAVGATFGDGR